jgi:hypothetical protein
MAERARELLELFLCLGTWPNRECTDKRQRDDRAPLHFDLHGPGLLSHPPQTAEPRIGSGRFDPIRLRKFQLFAIAVFSSAARTPLASFKASSLAQK